MNRAILHNSTECSCHGTRGDACPICNDEDPACLMVTCEERGRALFRRLTLRELRQRQDLTRSQLALLPERVRNEAKRERVALRLQATERLLTEAVLERLPA